MHFFIFLQSLAADAVANMKVYNVMCTRRHVCCYGYEYIYNNIITGAKEQPETSASTGGEHNYCYYHTVYIQTTSEKKNQI